MTKVEFKFDIDQKVKNKLDEIGIVNMAALDDHGNKTYYVDIKGGKGSWIKEDSLLSD